MYQLLQDQLAASQDNELKLAQESLHLKEELQETQVAHLEMWHNALAACGKAAEDLAMTVEQKGEIESLKQANLTLQQSNKDLLFENDHLKGSKQSVITEQKVENTAEDHDEVEYLKQDISSLERINGMLERDLLRLRTEREQSHAIIADQAAEWGEQRERILELEVECEEWLNADDRRQEQIRRLREKVDGLENVADELLQRLGFLGS
jgi:chromosome segregation ATPase